MTTESMAFDHTRDEARASWMPMIAIALGQMIMSFNVASLPVALGQATSLRPKARGRFDLDRETCRAT